MVHWIKVLAYLNHLILTHEWPLFSHGKCVHCRQMWCASLMNFLLKKVKVEFCQKWVFLLFTKTSKFYPKCLDYCAKFLDYCANLPSNTCIKSKPHIKSTHTKTNYTATQCTMQFLHRWKSSLDNFYFSTKLY